MGDILLSFLKCLEAHLIYFQNAESVQLRKDSLEGDWASFAALPLWEPVIYLELTQVTPQIKLLMRGTYFYNHYNYILLHYLFLGSVSFSVCLILLNISGCQTEYAFAAERPSDPNPFRLNPNCVLS